MENKMTKKLRLAKGKRPKKAKKMTKLQKLANWLFSQMLQQRQCAAIKAPTRAVSEPTGYLSVSATYILPPFSPFFFFFFSFFMEAGEKKSQPGTYQ